MRIKWAKPLARFLEHCAHLINGGYYFFVITVINSGTILYKEHWQIGAYPEENKQSCEGAGNHNLCGTIERAGDVYPGKDTF